MLRFFLKSLFLVIAGFIVFACSKDRSILQVQNRNFLDQIDLQQNLMFTFNNDLVDDSLVDQWIDEEYLKIEPKVRGRFKWTAKNELVFSPDYRFSPSTEYTITLTDKLLAKADDISLPEEINFRFHTPFLNVQSTSLFWSRKETNRSVIELRTNLNFNYKVDPVEVKKLMAVSVAGKDMPYELLSSSHGETVQIGIAQGDVTYDEKELKIIIKPGLKCLESEFVSNEAIVKTSLIPSKDKFRIAQASAVNDDKPYIHVVTNQELSDGKITKYIKISPSLPFTVEPVLSGFYIKGAFQTGESYDLTISKDLKGTFGGTLEKDFEQSVFFGEQKPLISFSSSRGMYLSGKGEKNIGMKVVNVGTIRVSLYKIYSNNILHFLRGSDYYDYYGYEEDYYYSDYDQYRWSDFDGQGDLIFNKTYETKSLSKVGGETLLNLDFKDINDFKGIYVVKVASDDERYVSCSKVLSISDVGLIVKRSGDDISVFANSILTTNPLEGVEITLVSHNNQSVLKGTTDGEGAVKFESVGKKASGFNIKMLTSKLGEDFNYMHLDQTSVNTSQFEIGGARNNPSGYEAFVYGERNIYRPGETINLNTIVRNNAWEPLPNAPVKVRLLLPNGKEFAAKQGKLSQQGGFETNFQLPQASVTGTYTAEVFSGNDVLLNSYQISVEEFIPDRIKINAKLNKEHVALNEAVNVDAQALNLFGPPAPNRNYEAEFVVKRKYFSPKGFEEYSFTPSSKFSVTFENDRREGKTDQQGKFNQSYDIPDSYVNSGLLDGKVFLTVFDETGRPVHKVKSFEVATQDVMYGIHNIDYYVGTNEPLKVSLAAVSPLGKAVSAPCQVKVVKLDWQTVLTKNDYGGYRYVSQKKESIFEDKNITVNGKNGSFTFTPVQSGEYEIRISKPGVEQYVSRSFYAYGWGTTTNASFEVNTDGKIDIESDKPKYEVGDNAKLLFKTPFKGRMLVTVERDKIFDQFFIQTDGRAASIDLPVKEEYLPNVYITATLLKPAGETSVPLTVAHGFAPLTAEKKEHKLPVQIKAAQKSRSRTKQNICVISNPESDIELTVSVVDEGILQLKDFSTPNPYSFFYRKRALEVLSYDVYPQILPELRSKSSVAGDGYDLEKRVNPLTNKRVKLVSFWSGTLKTNSEGEACYTVDIPQFSGDLRIMAVAHKGKSFGSSSVNMKVADPVVVSTGLPRFLSPMDTVIVPVTMTNTTATSAPAVASVSVSGPLQIIGDASRKLTLAPNEEARVEFIVIAKASIGEAKVVAEVKAMNENFKEELDITVRPPSSLLKISGYGTVENGKSSSFSLLNDFIPSSTEAQLIVSRSPLVQFRENLDYLIGYPHGCVEQTVSRAFPQVYLKEIMKSMGIKSKSNQNPEYYVQEAIRKLQSMQLYNGGLSYWQGGYEPSWWGSVYAAHFLQEAKKAGYDVKNDMLERLYGYLQQKIKEKDYQWYSYYDGTGVIKKKEIAPREVFYSLYILAKVGKQDMSVMNYYKTNYNVLSLDSRYQLAMTYYLLGDHASYRTLLPVRFEGERSTKAFGGSFYSPVRDMAMALNTMIDVDPTNGQIPVLANHLTKAMRGEKYLSTQENAFSMLALGKMAKSAEGAPSKAAIMVDGKKVASFEGKDIILTDKIAGKDLKIVPEGSGNLYYFWSVEGLSSTGQVKEEDNFIRVRRTFYDRKGQQITSNKFNQNDLVVVKLTVQSTDNSVVENVVITDMLPAGFEIENPRLSETADMPWIKNNANPQHFDIRDDRINLFTEINGRSQEFYYLVRAVSPGTFRVGPASADAMYNGEYHSYNGAGLITIFP